jgi:hypothetical protein
MSYAHMPYVCLLCLLCARLHALVLELGHELAQVLEQLLLQLPLRLQRLPEALRLDACGLGRG